MWFAKYTKGKYSDESGVNIIDVKQVHILIHAMKLGPPSMYKSWELYIGDRNKSNTYI